MIYCSSIQRLIIVVGILVLSSGCACHSGANHAGTDPQTTTTALMRLDDEWSASAGKRDVHRVASFYAADAIVFPPNEPVVRGREASKKVWATYLADPSFQISWKANDAHLSDDGKLGFTSGPYEASYNGADGKKVTEKGKFLCIWAKQPDGSWKAIRDMWNADAK